VNTASITTPLISTILPTFLPLLLTSAGSLSTGRS